MKLIQENGRRVAMRRGMAAVAPLGPAPTSRGGALARQLMMMSDAAMPPVLKLSSVSSSTLAWAPVPSSSK